MQRRSSWFSRAAGLALCALGCSKQNESPKPGPSSSSASAPSALTAAPAASLNAGPPATKAGCRALDVTGRASVDGAPLASNALLDGEHWVELEKGATISLRHTVTTREFKLIGPARILPCRAGGEQLLLARGQLTTSANLGVRPGAEVLIATPGGTVRYGDAALDVEFAGVGLRVRVKQGEAWVEPETKGKPPFKNPVRIGAEARLLPEPRSARELVATCQAAAQVAADSAQHVLHQAPSADAGASTLGERAAAHMRDRAQARVACAIASAALGGNDDATERGSLSASVARADLLWQSVPHALSGQKN